MRGVLRAFGRRLHGQRRTRGIVALFVTFSAVALVAGNTASGSQAAGPDFSLAIGPSTQTLGQGQTTGYIVETAAIDGFAGPIALTLSGLPTGITGVFTPASLAPGATSFLKLTTSATAPLGTFPFTVTGKSGALQHTATSSVSVDLALLPKCLVNISGTVTENTPAKAVLADASVSVGSKAATTNSLGVYNLENVELGVNNAPILASVLAKKDPPAGNHIGTYWARSTDTYLVCGRNVNLDFSLTKVIPAQLSGTVVEGEIVGGDYTHPVVKAGPIPIPGAKAGFGTVVTSAPVTDANGAFVFKDDKGLLGFRLNDENQPLTTTIKALSPTSQPVRQRYWPTDPAIAVDPIDPNEVVVLPPIPLVRQCTASVSGTIKFPGGGAFGSATVQVRAASVNDVVTLVTGTDGKYNVPAILFGHNNQPTALTVTVSREGSITKVVDTPVATCGAQLVVDVTMGETTTTAPVIPVKYGSVQGKIVDGTTGLGVAGIPVALSPCEPEVTGDCEAAPTDASGNYTFAKVPVGLETSDVLNSIVSTPFPTSPVPDYWKGSVNVTVKVGAPTTAPELRLLRRLFGATTGVVSDSASGQPLAGATMTTTAQPRVACGPPCLTAANGSYSYSQVELNTNNTNRTANVTATIADYWPKTKSVIFEAGATKVTDFPLVKKCVGSTIEGTVVNAITQLPITGAKISTVNPSGQPAVPIVTTDTNGRYKLEGVSPGVDNVPRATVVTAEATGYYTAKLTTVVPCGAQIELNFGFRPTITSLSPTSGPIAGGTKVTITGTDLAGISAVTFDGVPGTQLTPVSGTSATVVSPAHAAGVVDVVLTTEGGSSTPTSASKFTYIGATTTTTTTSTTTSTSTTVKPTTTTTPPTSTTTSTSTTVKPTTTTTPPTSTTTSTSTTVKPTTTTSTSTTVKPTTTTSTTIKPTTTTSTSTTVKPTTTTSTSTTTTTSTSTTVKPTTTTSTSTTVKPTTTTSTTIKPTTTTTKPTTTTTPGPTTTVPPQPTVEPAAAIVAAVLWLILLLLFGGG